MKKTNSSGPFKGKPGRQSSPQKRERINTSKSSDNKHSNDEEKKYERNPGKEGKTYTRNDSFKSGSDKKDYTPKKPFKKSYDNNSEERTDRDSKSDRFDQKKFSPKSGNDRFEKKSDERRDYKKNDSKDKRDFKSSSSDDKRFPNKEEGRFKTNKFSKRGNEDKVPMLDGKGNTLYRKKATAPDYDKLEDEYQKQFKGKKHRQEPSEEEEKTPTEVRLNKYIANAGICSRRDADKLITSGEIKINEKVVTELGYKVKPKDKVKYKGKVLSGEKPVYVLLNKPKNFITTVSDPEGRKTVMDLVKNAGDERIFPVGRLDRATTGLLLLTNDGDLAKKFTHPSSNVKKVYMVELDKPLTKNDYLKIMSGIELEDGPITPDDLAYVTDDKKQIGIELHSGRNRIVRRIFESLGYSVLRLDRTMFGPLIKKDLPRGNWRFISPKELNVIKKSLKNVK